MEKIDGKALFKEDVWERPEGGGGRTCVIENGNVFEKGGVNISGVHGKLPESMQKYLFLPDLLGYAGAVVLVLLILLLWFMFAKWNEKTGKFSAL